MKSSLFTVGLVLSAAAGVSAAQINTYGKLEIVADDKSFSARVTGRVHMDGNFYSNKADNRQLTSGTFMRAARIGVSGNFREWEYSIEYDIAGDVPSVKDGYLRKWMGPGKFWIGQFKVFEGLEELASTNDMIFMERPYASETVPSYKTGAGYAATWRKLGYSGNLYSLQDSAAGSQATNDGVGAAARAYIAPINDKYVITHLGVSYARENADVGGARVWVRPAGRADVYRNGDDFRFVLFDRRSERTQISRVNLESAFVDGPLYVQGEYQRGSAESHSRADDTFTAWYVQTSFFLTGESRRYDFRTGSFSRPKEPNRLTGAFEIAARYQQAKRLKVTGAELTTTEYGITYYANINVRYMLNYSLPNNKLLNDHPRLLAMRAQFDF